MQLCWLCWRRSSTPSSAGPSTWAATVSLRRCTRSQESGRFATDVCFLLCGTSSMSCAAGLLCRWQLSRKVSHCRPLRRVLGIVHPPRGGPTCTTAWQRSRSQCTLRWICGLQKMGYGLALQTCRTPSCTPSPWRPSTLRVSLYFAQDSLVQGDRSRSASCVHVGPT